MLYRFVNIPLEHGDDPSIQVGYTDCVESSFLRMLHLVLSSARPTIKAPEEASIDLPYLRSISDDPGLIDFFERHPSIVYLYSYYDEGNPGFDVRAEWCDFLTRKKDRFTYARTGTNIFQDDLVRSGVRSFDDYDFQFEVDTTIRNIITLFTASFPGIRESMPPIDGIVEDIDETSTYQPYLDVIANFFTRPERNFELKFRVSERFIYGEKDQTERLFTQVVIGVEVNGYVVWKWSTQRKCYDSYWMGAHSEINER